MERYSVDVSLLRDLPSHFSSRIDSDEADVFLDSRGSMGEADLEKNAMVAGWY